MHISVQPKGHLAIQHQQDTNLFESRALAKER